MEADDSATVEGPRSAAEAESNQTESDTATDILARLLVSVQDGNRDEQRAAWASIQDPDIMAALADGWRHNEPVVSASLSTLS